MGTCCSNAHDVDRAGNMQRQKVADQEPSESKEYGPPLEFDTQTIIEHIFSSNTTAVINAWRFADKNSAYEIEIANGLPLIFLYFTQSYVEHKKGNDYYSRNMAVQKKCKRVANDLSDYYCTILANYEPENTDKKVLTNDEYLECFITYLQEPTPASENLTNSETVEESSVVLEIKQEMKEEIKIDRQETDGMPIKKLSVYESTFDMLKYISTSPTIIDNPSFSADTTVEVKHA